MKKFIYLICIVVLFAYGCKRERNCCVLPQRSSGMTAERNDASWSPAGVSGTLTDNSYILAAGSFSVLNSLYTKIDSLNIQIPSGAAVGTYKLSGSQVYYGTFGTNGTATPYKLDTTFNNVLNITSYTEMSNQYALDQNYVEIKGTFNLKFIDPSNTSGTSFSNGSFFTILKH